MLQTGNVPHCTVLLSTYYTPYVQCSPILLLTQGMNKTNQNKMWALENTCFVSTKARVPGSHIKVLGMMGNPVISELRRKSRESLGFPD